MDGCFKKEISLLFLERKISGRRHIQGKSLTTYFSPYGKTQVVGKLGLPYFPFLYICQPIVTIVLLSSALTQQSISVEPSTLSGSLL